MIRLQSVALILLSFLSTPVMAEDFVIDDTHAHIGFRILHLNASYTYGRFDRMSGTMTTGDSPSLSISVEADSINTNNEDRDNHLRGVDFFDVENHPTIAFVSSSVETDGDDLLITGDLTLLGVSKEITVTVTKIGERDIAPFGLHIGYQCEFKIKRSDFGMDWGLALDLLGDEVDMTIAIEMIKPQDDEEQE